MSILRFLRRRLALVLLLALTAACITTSLGRGPRHGWWDGLGPVLPHDDFPADCKLCHVGDDWTDLRVDFRFDHEAETGRALEGAHADARCLLCHNDRGPVQVFDTLGCAGCHEDRHFGRLGTDCERCHDQVTWQPQLQVMKHDHSRFPLVGIHASTQCYRCHPGAEVGNFSPTPVECVNCHADDLAAANNPDHQALGWIDRCDRCHMPLDWQAVELDPNAATAGAPLGLPHDTPQKPSGGPSGGSPGLPPGHPPVAPVSGSGAPEWLLKSFPPARR